MKLIKYEARIWDEYIKRVNKALDREFKVPVPITKLVRAKHASKLRKSVDNYTDLQISNIDIGDQQSIATFITQAQAKEKEVDSVAQKMHALHNKYKGDDWKYFVKQDENDTSWRVVYDRIEKKMKHYDLYTEAERLGLA